MWGARRLRESRQRWAKPRQHPRFRSATGSVNDSESGSLTELSEIVREAVAAVLRTGSCYQLPLAPLRSPRAPAPSSPECPFTPASKLSLLFEASWCTVLGSIAGLHRLLVEAVDLPVRCTEMEQLREMIAVAQASVLSLCARGRPCICHRDIRTLLPL